MKTLYIVRHAKSSWEYDVPDDERPLKKRGISDANLVSNTFKKQKLDVDAVFSSYANRAISTCNIFMENLDINPSLLLKTKALYDFSGQQALSFISNIDKTHNNVLIFGHNNAFNWLANVLGDEPIDHLPTCGLVQISFEIEDWQHIQNRGNTNFILFPRHLKH